MKRLALVGLLVVAACSGSGSSGAGGGGGTLEFNDFCTAYLDAVAAKLSTCNSGPKDAWATTLKDFLPCANLKKAVDAKRAAYDGTAAQACITSVGSAACASLLSSSPASSDCTKALAGKVAVGGTCYDRGVDCEGDSYCALTSMCEGKCKARIASGAACVAGDECVKGYSCVNSTCTLDPPEGTAGIGSSCTASTLCKPGLACDQVTKNCAAYVKEGQACEFGHHTCETFTSCGSGNTCLRYGAVGAACGATINGMMNEYAGCLNGYCKLAAMSATGTCTARGDTGATCNNGDECLSGTCTATKCVAACTVP